MLAFRDRILLEFFIDKLWQNRWDYENLKNHHYWNNGTRMPTHCHVISRFTWNKMDVPNLVRKISKFNRIQEQFPLTKHVSQHSKAVIFVKSHFSLEPKKRWNVNKEWRIKPSFFDEMEKKSSLPTTIHDHEQESSEKSIRRKENGHAIKIKRFCANTESALSTERGQKTVSKSSRVTFHDDIGDVSTPSINEQHSWLRRLWHTVWKSTQRVALQK